MNVATSIKRNTCVVSIVLGLASSHAATVFVQRDAIGANDGSSWANAFTNLQDPLAMAGDEIWVAAGAYCPAPAGGDRNASFQLQTGHALYGGFAGGETNRAQRNPSLNRTVLSGDLLADDGANWVNTTDNSFHVVTATNVDATVVLDGFTITGGNSSDYGAGLRLENASPTLANCAVVTNLATFGAGMTLVDSAPLITNCTFSGNVAWSGRGGAIYIQSTAPLTNVIRNCRFIANQAWVNAGPGDAGAIWSSFDCTLDVSGSLFESNEARWRFASGNMAAIGGAAVIFGAGSRIDRCVFRQNRAHIGGALWLARDTTVANCLFVGNEAYRVSSGAYDYGGYAGAIYSANGTNLIASCTLHANKARSTGGVWVWLGEMTIADSILWSNTSTEVDAKPTDSQFNGSPKLRYSCIRSLLDPIPGEDPPDPAKYPGCITNAPLFVNERGPDNIAGNADDNVGLQITSPCIDAGSNALLPVWVTTDLAGKPRRFDVPSQPDTGAGTAPITDMGAYEYVIAPDIALHTAREGDSGLRLIWNSPGTNWLCTLEFSESLSLATWSPVPPTNQWPAVQTNYLVNDLNVAPQLFYRVKTHYVLP